MEPEPLESIGAAYQTRQNIDISAALADIRNHLDLQDSAVKELKETTDELRRVTDAHDAYVKQQMQEDAAEADARRKQEQEDQLKAAEAAGAARARAEDQEKVEAANSQRAKDRALTRQRWERVTRSIYVLIAGVLTITLSDILNSLSSGRLKLNGETGVVAVLAALALGLIIWSYRNPGTGNG